MDSGCSTTCIQANIGDVSPTYFDIEIYSDTVDLSSTTAAELQLKLVVCGCAASGDAVIWAVTVLEATPGFVLLRHFYLAGETAAAVEWVVVPRLTFAGGAQVYGSSFKLEVVDPWSGSCC